MSWRKDVGATTIHAQKLAERATSGGRVQTNETESIARAANSRFAPAHWGIPVGWLSVRRGLASRARGSLASRTAQTK